MRNWFNELLQGVADKLNTTVRAIGIALVIAITIIALAAVGLGFYASYTKRASQPASPPIVQTPATTPAAGVGNQLISGKTLAVIAASCTIITLFLLYLAVRKSKMTSPRLQPNVPPFPSPAQPQGQAAPPATAAAPQIVRPPSNPWRILTWTAAIVLTILILVIGGKIVYSLLVSTPATVGTSAEAAVSIPRGVTRVVDDCPRPSFPGVGTYRVTALPGTWSEKYCMPAGFYTHQEAVGGAGRFKTETNTGFYSFSPEKSDTVKGWTSWVKVMAAGTEPQQVDIKIYREIPAPPAATTLPSRTLPFLPLAPPLLKDDAKM